jgi:hypothetical protein
MHYRDTFYSGDKVVIANTIITSIIIVQSLDKPNSNHILTHIFGTKNEYLPKKGAFLKMKEEAIIPNL